MKSNSKQSKSGSSKTSVSIKGEPTLVDESNGHSGNLWQPHRSQRRRIQKKEPYSPEVFVETRSEFVLKDSTGT